MTQEGQALPSPSPPENPVEPNTTITATNLPTETYNQAEQDKPGSRARDEIEEGQQEEEEIRGGEEESQGEAHEEGDGRVEVKDAEGEGELQEEKIDGCEDVDQKTDGGAEGEKAGMRGEGCVNVEVSSVGEEATHEVEELKEKEEKENEEMSPSTEKEAIHSPQVEGLVY